MAKTQEIVGAAQVARRAPHALTRSLRALRGAWLTVTLPLRWVLSHLALSVVFFGIVTPIGLWLRRSGHDPLRLRADAAESERSMWLAVEQSDGRPDAAFRQF